MSARGGWAYLVGAGPGDPGLITRRGLELLRSCDVCLYDRLVAPELLNELQQGATAISVGKDTGPGARSQAEIDTAVVEHARAGRSVVRLKGGDPYVLGRGADEAQALAAAGIPFEVVPGVSASVAVPSYAGIPLTHGGVASSFMVMTAHAGMLRSDSGVDWDAIARGPDTIVLMMGMTSLREVVKRLVDGGRDPDQPVAAIRWGTTERQSTVTGTLTTIADEVETAGLTPPATVVIGEVVKLRDALDWFEQRPLFGKRVVVTRAEHQAASLAEQLAIKGARVIFLPVIKILPPRNPSRLDQAIRKLNEGLYAWTVFTSRNAFEMLYERLSVLGMDARAFGRTRVAAVGPVTAQVVRAHGVRPDLVPETYTGAALADNLGHGSGHVLIPRAQNAPREILTVLENLGWAPEEVVAYRNVIGDGNTPAAEEVRAGGFDIVTFASGSAVRNFTKLIGRPEELGLAPDSDGSKKVATIGPKTATVARDLGFRIDATARDHTGEGLVDALTAID